MNEPEKLFKMKPGKLNGLIILGLLMTALGIYDFITIGSTNVPLVAGIFFIIISVMGRDYPILKLFDDHIEIRPGPMARKKLILYSEIESLEEKPKKSFLSVNQNGKKKKITLPMTYLTKDDQEELIKELRSRMYVVRGGG